MSNSSQQTVVGVASGYPEHHQNADLEHVDDPVPGSGIGGIKVPSAGITGNTTSQNVEGSMGLSGTASATIGGTSSENVNPNPASPTSLSGTQYTRLEKYIDPFTGEVTYRKVLVKTKMSRHGEKVHDLITLNS